jgi:hypothetical protein
VVQSDHGPKNGSSCAFLVYRNFVERNLPEPNLLGLSLVSIFNSSFDLFFVRFFQFRFAHLRHANPLPRIVRCGGAVGKMPRVAQKWLNQLAASNQNGIKDHRFSAMPCTDQNLLPSRSVEASDSSHKTYDLSAPGWQRDCSIPGRPCAYVRPSWAM